MEKMEETEILLLQENQMVMLQLEEEEEEEVPVISLPKVFRR